MMFLASAVHSYFHLADEQTHTTGNYTYTTQTYYGAPMQLGAGHMIFTNPLHTPLKMPIGKYAILGFTGDIVDENHEPVPLDSAYDHHWIAKNDVHRNQLCNKGLEYVFGIGAESRNNPVNFPAGFGYLVESGVTWGANVHLLRTEGLAGDNPHKAAKECNECYYSPGKGAQCTPAQNGTFKCCGENDNAGISHCPVDPRAALPNRTYHLRYSLNFTREVSKVTPLSVGVLSTPKCATYYEVLRDNAKKIDTSTYEWTCPTDVDVHFAVGHQHTGAINISLSRNGEFVCASVARYGTRPSVAGDEKGYLVEMSSCIDESTGPLKLKKGDRLRLDALYYVGDDDDRVAYSDGTHLNVMSYLYVGYMLAGRGARDASEVDLITGERLRGRVERWYETSTSFVR